MAERGVRRVALVEEVVQAGREHGRLLLRIRRRSGADPAGVCLARASGCASMRRGDCCMHAVTPTLLPPGFKIGRANGWTTVTNAHRVCRLLFEKQKQNRTY